MNKKEFAAAIAAKENIVQAEAERMINAVLQGIEDALAIGETIKIVGFGTFETTKRAAHIGRNPHDPEQAIEIPAHNVVKFKAGKELKEIVNK